MISYNDSILKRLEVERKEELYQNACNLMQTEEIKELYTACDKLKEIIDYKDAEKKIAECKLKVKNLIEIQRKEDIKRREEQEKDRIAYKKKRRKIVLIGISLVVFLIMFYGYELKHQKQLTKTLCEKLYGTIWEATETKLPIQRLEIINASTARAWKDEYAYKKVEIKIKGDNWKQIQLSIYYLTDVAEGINYTYTYKVRYNGMEPEELCSKDSEDLKYKCVEK